MASVSFRIASTIFTLAISRGPAVSGQSHSPCCRQSPRPAAAQSQEKQPVMVWQTSLRPYLVADARRDAIAPDVPPEPQYSDLNLSANHPWTTNSSGSLQYRPFPAAERFHFQSFHLSRRDENRAAVRLASRLASGSRSRFVPQIPEPDRRSGLCLQRYFETRANPDKGGHGLAVLFRQALGKTRKRAGHIGRRES